MLILLAVGFAAAAGYVRACDDLTRTNGGTGGQGVMTWQGWLQIAVFGALITGVVKPLGGLRNVDGGGSVPRAFTPLEPGLYRLAGVDPSQEQGWLKHLRGMLLRLMILR